MPFRKEEDFDTQKSGQESRFVIYNGPHFLLEARQLSYLILNLLISASQAVSLDEFSYSNAKSDEQLWCSVDPDTRFRVCDDWRLRLFCLLLYIPRLWHCFSDDEMAVGEWVIYEGHWLLRVTYQEKQVQHEVGYFGLLARLLCSRCLFSRFLVRRCLCVYLRRVDHQVRE